MRIHVIGSDVIAILIKNSGASIDYRDSGSRAEYSAMSLDNSLSGKLIESTSALGLVFAGWDFKIDSSGAFWCLEANPMPGYSFYDQFVNGAISASLIDYLWQ